MRDRSLQNQFYSWLLMTGEDLEFADKVHCFSVRRNLLLVPGERVDFVTVRHERAAHPESRQSFSVGLWKLNTGPIDLAAIDEMSRQLQAFRAWYADVLNQFEMEGRQKPEPTRLHGNLVGSSVASSCLVQLLSSGFGDLALWTYRRDPVLADGAARRVDRDAEGSGPQSAGLSVPARSESGERLGRVAEALGLYAHPVHQR